MSDYLDTLSKFASETGFEDLRPEAVEAAKDARQREGFVSSFAAAVTDPRPSTGLPGHLGLGGYL